MTFDREDVGRKGFWSKRSSSEERKVSFERKCETKIVWSTRSFCSEERSKKLLLPEKKSGEKGFGQRGPGLKR